MLDLAKETGQIGTQGIDQHRKLPTRLVAADMVHVLGIARKTADAQAFGQAGPDQFLFAFMQVDLAVVIDHLADLTKLLVRQDQFFIRSCRHTPRPVVFTINPAPNQSAREYPGSS